MSKSIPLAIAAPVIETPTPASVALSPYGTIAEFAVALASTDGFGSDYGPSTRPATPAPFVRSRLPYPASGRIVVVATANPKRPGTAARAAFDLYAGVSTVAEYGAALLRAGFDKSYLKAALDYDGGKGFVRVE